MVMLKGSWALFYLNSTCFQLGIRAVTLQNEAALNKRKSIH